MASGCYALQAVRNDRWVARPAAASTPRSGAAHGALPLHFQADRPRQVPALRRPQGLRRPRHGRPGRLGRDAERGRRLDRDAQPGRRTSSGSATARASRSPPTARWSRRPPRRSGCTRRPAAPPAPRSQHNVTGRPFTRRHAVSRRCAATSTRTPTGWPSSSSAATCTAAGRGTRTASPYALVDCPDHTLDRRQRRGAGGAAVRASRTHDPVGWPTFKDWPAPDSLTHEGTYYKWLERVLARRPADLRQPARREQPALRALPAQAQLLRRHGLDPPAGHGHVRRSQDYIDAQYGGPGKGWYRIVTNPFQARQVINAGQAGRGHGHRDQRAVRLHDEARRPDLRAPRRRSTGSSTRCASSASRQMELVNKFDNALSGVAGDDGADRASLVNAANFLETGSFWDMRHCAAGRRPRCTTSDQLAAPGHQPPRSRTRCSARSRRSRRPPPLALPLYPAAAPLQHAAA